MQLAAAAPALHAQAKPAPAKPTASTPAKPATSAPAAAQAPKTATSAAAKPQAKAAGSGAASATAPKKQAAAKPRAKSVVAKRPAPKPAETAAAAAPESEAKVARRDPFESLISRQQAAARNQAALPPGIAGLQVSTLRLDGIVKSPRGMIAVVSNPQARTYFLREGDKLYDGQVEKIAMDGVSFHEEGKDAFGKPVERQVNKRIYSSAGEQQ
jgi:Tfp pilus assembly protein PilP